MPTPDASQYTQFRRYASISGDAIGSVGSKISPFNTSYSIPILSASSQALFLPSANKEAKFANLSVYSGPITLDSPVTNPIVPRGGYHVFTFTPTENGWYRMILDQFGDNDMDLFVGYGNSELDIPAVVDYDLYDNYDTPRNDVKVFSASGDSSDQIASYFSAGCTYQVLVIGYDGGYGGTYTLTVRDNLITLGTPLVSRFYYTGAYQLYRFVAPTTRNYRFQLDFVYNFPYNDADLFISEPNTTLDIQGCIDWDTQEAPFPPESLMVSGTYTTEDLREVALTSGSTYEVLVYEYYTANLFRPYTLTVSLELIPILSNLVVASITQHSADLMWNESGATSRSVVTYEYGTQTVVAGTVSSLTAGACTVTGVGNNSPGWGPYTAEVTLTNSYGSTSASITVSISCFLGSTKLQTRSGPVQASEVVLGTELLQPDGSYTKVVKAKESVVSKAVPAGDARLFADPEEKMIVTAWHKIRFADEKEEVKADVHPRLHEVFREMPFQVYHFELEDISHKILIADTDIIAESFSPNQAW